MNNVQTEVGKRIGAINNRIEEEVKGESKLMMDIVDQKIDERSSYERMLEQRIDALERMVESLIDREQNLRGNIKIGRGTRKRRMVNHDFQDDDDDGNHSKKQDSREDQDEDDDDNRFSFGRSVSFQVDHRNVERQSDVKDDYGQDRCAEAIPSRKMNGSHLVPHGLSYSQRKVLVTHSIGARDSKVVHVDVASAPAKIKWSMYTDGKDISFSVAFIPGLQKDGNEDTSTGESKVVDRNAVRILEPTRLTHNVGSYMTKCEGTLTFFLDNSFSWVNTKVVTCEAKLCASQ